ASASIGGRWAPTAIVETIVPYNPADGPAGPPDCPRPRRRAVARSTCDRAELPARTCAPARPDRAQEQSAALGCPLLRDAARALVRDRVRDPRGVARGADALRRVVMWPVTLLANVAGRITTRGGVFPAPRSSRCTSGTAEASTARSRR